MKVTIDTNIMFQALYSSSGASHQIIKLIRDQEIQMVISKPVFLEYQDVLLRKENLSLFHLTKKDIDQFLEFIAFIGKPIDIRFLLRPNLQDENDNIFTELAFAGDCRYLITKNIKDFRNNTELMLDSFLVITPSDFLKEWRNLHD
jgi:putative PIN family toxin of toxin-antitoxin system